MLISEAPEYLHNLQRHETTIIFLMWDDIPEMFNTTSKLLQARITYLGFVAELCASLVYCVKKIPGAISTCMKKQQ
jgi:hypothetical protein